MDSKDLREQQLDAWLALNGQVPLAAGETVRLPVLSGSMLPSMPIGAILEIAPVSPAECRVGDVVVFTGSERRLTAHRVLFILRLGSRRLVLQKGDNFPFGGWIRAGRIRGRVIRVIPADGDESAAIEAFSPAAAEKSHASLRSNVIRHFPRKIRDFLRDSLRRSKE